MKIEDKILILDFFNGSYGYIKFFDDIRPLIAISQKIYGQNVFSEPQNRVRYVNHYKHITYYNDDYDTFKNFVYNEDDFKLVGFLRKMLDCCKAMDKYNHIRIVLVDFSKRVY